MAIKTFDRDMNRSRDANGVNTRLKRSYDQETSMDKSMNSHFHDDHPTGTISKHSLSDLHHGDHESPLTAAGEQGVVEVSPMGSDFPDHVPAVQKGSTVDQSTHSSRKSGSYSEVSKSAPHKPPMGKGSSLKGASHPRHPEAGPRNPKGMGRSVDKELIYKAKKSSY